METDKKKILQRSLQSEKKFFSSLSDRYILHEVGSAKIKETRGGSHISYNSSYFYSISTRYIYLYIGDILPFLRRPIRSWISYCGAKVVIRGGEKNTPGTGESTLYIWIERPLARATFEKGRWRGRNVFCRRELAFTGFFFCNPDHWNYEKRCATKSCALSMIKRKTRCCKSGKSEKSWLVIKFEWNENRKVSFLDLGSRDI